jgi:hypothetical protein
MLNSALSVSRDQLLASSLLGFTEPQEDVRVVGAVRRRQDDEVVAPSQNVETARSAVDLGLAVEGAAFVESPARRLQLDLEQELAKPAQRWSARRTLAFVVLTNGLFWAGVICVVRGLA